MTDEILRFKPGEAAKYFLQDKKAIEKAAADSMIEKAKEILGQDFLGYEAVQTMANKIKAVGINVEFKVQDIPFPYNEKDLELAKQNEEMLVLRTGSMDINGQPAQLSLLNFRELFKIDPKGGTSPLFFPTDWYANEPFAKEPGHLGLGWALVKKDVLPNTTSKNWNEQEQILQQYAYTLQQRDGKETKVRRRTVTEAVWDTMLYYTNNNSKVLQDKYDWTQTRASSGRLVYVGVFDSIGLLVSNYFPDRSDSLLGVCPSR